MLGAGIAERDVVERDAAVDVVARSIFDRRRPIPFRAALQQVEDAVEAGEAVLEFGRALGEHGERAEQHQQIDEEHHQVAERQVAFEHSPAAVQSRSSMLASGTMHFPDDFDGPHPPPGVQLLPAHEMVAAHDAGRSRSVAGRTRARRACRRTPRWPGRRLFRARRGCGDAAGGCG